MAASERKRFTTWRGNKNELLYKTFGTSRERQAFFTKTERTKEWQSYTRLVPRDMRDGVPINHSDKLIVSAAVFSERQKFEIRSIWMWKFFFAVVENLARTAVQETLFPTINQEQKCDCQQRFLAHTPRMVSKVIFGLQLNMPKQTERLFTPVQSINTF